MSGAYTSIKELIQLRLAAKDIQLFTPNKVRSSLAGQYQSKLKGRGVDFAEVRVYQPGDDVRTIDWRVTARTQVPHTKLFQEERERPVFLLVEQSLPLFFGSSQDFKSVTAAEAAAAFAWASLQHGDRVGGLVFNHQQQHQEIKPKRSKKSVLQLLHTITEMNHALSWQQSNSLPASEYFCHALRYSRQLIKPGSAVILVGNFYQLPPLAEQHLYKLSQHSDVFIVNITDPLEVQLPKPGVYAVTDGQHRLNINSRHSQSRQRYQQQWQTQQQQLITMCQRYRMPLLQLSTTEPALQQLVEKLAGQRRRHG
ncbi:DUF58 domain-containing protein [Spartinivicinus ruber]|uniref:DUF58 domain-containing protein n=1 Tax=Spartinivicinus ruber TaxID=2683272 RepID=UPI0013D2643E|nr:DUF58 domain-containing protein [Spartinivicinus ruber]